MIKVKYSFTLHIVVIITLSLNLDVGWNHLKITQRFEHWLLVSGDLRLNTLVVQRIAAQDTARAV
jgi:hypothetical protein